MKAIFRSICCVIFLLFGFYQAQSQAYLSFQGVLKKANGVAVEDGTYSMVFRLYVDSVGGTPLWSETQGNVEVTSGIYSVILGKSNPLDVAFDQIYFLGVQVGSTELTPRFRLTSAPYALSLIGESNVFPSSGTVLADSARVAGRLSVGHANLPTTNNQSLNVNGGVLAKGGAPGTNGVSNAGYAFNGNSGDKDSGLFSIADGQVSIYVNNAQIAKANSSGMEITGNLNLSNGGAVIFNGQKDWILVDSDDFSTGVEGWNTYDHSLTIPIGTGMQIGSVERLNSTLNDYVDWFIRPATTNLRLLKKQFILNNIPHTEVKIEFTHIFLGTWDGETAFGGVASGEFSLMTSMWRYLHNSGNWMTAGIYAGDAPGRDLMISDEMIFNLPTNVNSFYLMFGNYLNQQDPDESWGLLQVKVYVR